MKADSVMVVCKMVRKGIISLSELQEFVGRYSDQQNDCIAVNKIVPVFCLMARNGQIPQSAVDELVNQHKRKHRVFAA